MEFGSTERTILETAERNRQPIPQKILDAPELLPGLELYYNGFQALTHDRPIGMGGEGTIPWAVMLMYCKEYEIDGEQREYFYLMVKALDKAYLEYRVKKRDAATPAKKG